MTTAFKVHIVDINRGADEHGLITHEIEFSLLRGDGGVGEFRLAWRLLTVVPREKDRAFDPPGADDVVPFNPPQDRAYDENGTYYLSLKDAIERIRADLLLELTTQLVTSQTIETQQLTNRDLKSRQR
jgi:hypothetical protein